MPEWKISIPPVDYSNAILGMEQRIADIAKGIKPELIWMLEHPPIYTAGTSANPEELLNREKFPVHKTGRGGKYTYHGPGQLVCYLMVDLKKRNLDIRQYLNLIEGWIIDTLTEFSIKAFADRENVGIWIEQENQKSKIAAIGIRVRKGITYHGFALNVKPDLSHYQGIIPCGIKENGITSIEKLGKQISINQIINTIKDKSPF